MSMTATVIIAILIGAAAAWLTFLAYLIDRQNARTKELLRRIEQEGL